jgi:hypothetical protein
MRYVDENQTSRREIERFPRQASLPSIGVENLDVPQIALGDESTSEFGRLVASFHTDHGARRADPLGEEVETTPRAATNFHGSRTHRQTDLIKQPPSFLCELLGLPLEPFLFGLPVAEEILISLCHANRWLDPRHTRGQVAGEKIETVPVGAMRLLALTKESGHPIGAHTRR